MNRFDRPVMFNANIQGYTPEIYKPNLEAQAAQITQKEKDLNTAQTEKGLLNPTYRSIDAKKAIEFKENLDKKYEEIYDIYKKKGIAQGDKATKDYISMLKKEKQNPHSEFNTFKELYDKEQAFYKSVNETYKDTPGADLNRMKAMSDYYSAYGSKAIDNFYDYETKSKKGTINNAEAFITPYLNIEEELFDRLDNLSDDQVVELLGDKGASTWFEKHTLKGISRDKVRNAAESLLGNELYKQQLGVEIWGQERLLNDDIAKQYTSQLFDSQIKQLDQQINAMSKLAKGDSQDVQNLQQILAQSGYSVGDIDGIYGAKTEAALNEFKKDIRKNKSDLNSNKSKSLNDKDLVRKIATEQVINGYVDSAVKTFYDEKKDLDLIYNKAKADNIKNSLKRQELEIMMQQIEKDESDLIFTPAPDLQFREGGYGEHLDKTLSDEIGSLEQVYFAEVLKNKNIANAVNGVEQEDILYLQRYSHLKQEDFLKKTQEKGIDADKSGQLYRLYNSSSVQTESFRNTLGQLNESKDKQSQLKEYQWATAVENVVSNEDMMDMIKEEFKDYDIDITDQQLVEYILDPTKSLDIGKVKPINEKEASERNRSQVETIKKSVIKNREKAILKKLKKSKDININPYQQLPETFKSRNIFGSTQGGKTNAQVNQLASKLWSSGKILSGESKSLVTNVDGKKVGKTKRKHVDWKNAQNVQHTFRYTNGKVVVEKIGYSKDGRKEYRDIKAIDDSNIDEAQDFLLNEYALLNESSSASAQNRKLEIANMVSSLNKHNDNFIFELNNKLAKPEDYGSTWTELTGKVKIPLKNGSPDILWASTDRSGQRYGFIPFTDDLGTSSNKVLVMMETDKGIIPHPSGAITKEAAKRQFSDEYVRSIINTTLKPMDLADVIRLQQNQ